MSKSLLHIGRIPISIGKIPICLDYTPPIDYGPLLLQFVTNDVGGSSFDPAFAVLSGKLTWDLGDGSIVNSNSFTHIYSLPGNKTVKVYQGTSPGPTSITGILMHEDKIVGPVDISSLTNLSGVMWLGNNPDLTNVINPVSSQVFTQYLVQNCSLNGTLDISGLTNLGGQFWANGNSNLQRILNPTTPQTFTIYSVYGCGLNGTLDLRGLSGLGGTFWAQNNTNLTQILNPTSSQTFSTYNADHCGLDGSLDLRGLSGLGGDFRVYLNPKLTKMYLPTSSTVFTYFYAQDCSLNGVLDISGLTGLGGTFDVGGNVNLTQILNPISSQTFNDYYADYCNLTGTLDLSSLTGLGGAIILYQNPNLTQIINPSSNKNVTVYWASGCDLTGTLDFRPLKRLGGNVDVQNNPNLTQVLNPDSSNAFTTYNVRLCDITGTLDISSLTGLGGSFQAQQNNKLTKILNPVSTRTIDYYYVYDSSLTGTLDVSGLTGLGGYFRCYNNLELTQVLLPTLSRHFYEFNARNCSLNTSNIDSILQKYYTYWNGTLPTSSSIINLSGGNSAWPTNGLSNTYLVGIQNIFDNSTLYDVSISINPPPLQTVFTRDSSFVVSAGGGSPLEATYYNNYLPIRYVEAGGGGGTEQLHTLALNTNTGIMTTDSCISYSYPASQTVMSGLLYVSKLFTTISSFIVTSDGSISKWKDNNSPIVTRGSQFLGSCSGKLISSVGVTGSDIEVYSYTADASGTLTRDSSLTFTSSAKTVTNHRLISGTNFVYLMRLTDSSVVNTDILKISGGVLTDTGYDVSMATPFWNYSFNGFENNGNLYLSYNGIAITKHSINQTTGAPTFSAQTSTDVSMYIGIDSNIVGTKLINESNDIGLAAAYRWLKSFNLSTLQLDGSLLRSGNNSYDGAGVLPIDNSMFIVYDGSTYKYETLHLSFV